jgi:hypothetical protein
MLCMQCYELDEPDTVLDGSDRAEFTAWCCFLVPGLLYCAWRHLSRVKACPRCGSHALMRESRAAAARRSLRDEVQAEPRFRHRADFQWPRPLASPRRRLRIGGLGALLVVVASASWLAAVADPTPARHALEVATLCWLAVSLWLARQFQRLVVGRHDAGCAAWDERGRRLNIERI